MKKLILSLSIIAMTASSFGSIVINIQGDGLRNDSNVFIPANSLVFLIASVTDGNFDPNSILEGASTAVGSLITGTDDYIVAKVPLASMTLGGFDVAFSSAGAGALNFSSVPGGLWGANDKLALVWFPALANNAAVIAPGSRYGLFTSATAGDGTDPWLTPANTGQIGLAFATSDGALGGSSAPALGRTSFTASPVPEPTSAFLVAVGAAGLMMRRRRQS